jgi:SOS-response transcriptional repressor LexA
VLEKAKPGDLATPDQRRTLTAILELTGELGYAPSVEQLRARLGLRSVSSVHRSLSYLRVKGYVDWNAGQARTLRVL